MSKSTSYKKEELDIIVENLDKETKEILEILEKNGYSRSLYSLNYKIRLLQTYHLSRKDVEVFCNPNADMSIIEKYEKHTHICELCRKRIAAKTVVLEKEGVLVNA